MNYKINSTPLINQTSLQYDQIIAQCKSIFEAKSHDYGTSWRVMRPLSIADQIYIKAQRIKTIEEKGTNQIDEGIESEFMGIINYCVIGLIQLHKDFNEEQEIEVNVLMERYNYYILETKNLMLKKNHDYGEAWRNMLVSTFTDMILMRILRIRQLLSPTSATKVSEGADSNFQDMLNYSVFALIQMQTSIK